MLDPFVRVRTSEGTGLVWSGGSLTWRNLVALARTAGSRLRGIAGDRIGICLPNDWKAVVTLLGCTQAGVTACLFSPRWPPRSIRAAAAKVGASMLVSDRTDLGMDVISSMTLMEPAEVPVNPEVKRSRWATIVYTSGSSGSPKAVTHALEAHVRSAEAVNRTLDLKSEDRWLLSLPLYHVAGISVLYRCLQSAATIVLSHSSDDLYRIIQRHSITHVSMVSTQLRRMLAEGMPVSPPASLRCVILGGGPVPLSQLHQACARGYPIRTTYGMTETASAVTLSEPCHHPESAGRALRHVRIRIADSGEIQVNGSSLCAGYWTQDGLEPALNPDGWLSTGDLGYLDEAGHLHVQGREDNRFISGGENIVPEEIERTLRSMPGVLEAVVVPVPDPEFGQRPVAFVRGEFDDARIRDYLEKRIPRFMIPELRVWKGAFPRVGIKTDRQQLAYLAGSTDPE